MIPIDELVAVAEQRDRLLGSQQALDLWQNSMTGIYYSCWACQAACPVGQARTPKPLLPQATATLIRGGCLDGA